MSNHQHRALRLPRPATLTMADVARAAGVSTQTVSRALNNTGRISQETRERVLKVVEELGYRPNTAARTLVNRRSGLIGIVMSDNDQYGPRLTMLNVEAALRAEGYGVSLASYDHGKIDQAHAAIRHLAAQGVEGVILIGATPMRISDTERAQLPLPVITVRGDADDPYSVGIDHTAGAVMATAYLLERGHQSVLHVGGPKSWLDAQLREAGWGTALTAAGRPVPEVQWRGDWTARSGYEVGCSILQEDLLAGTTAVFVANDQMAMGLCRALLEAGLKIPDDVSVMGYDDLPEAGYYNPPLTTVRQDLPALGALAAHRVLDMIAGRDAHAAGLLAPTIVSDDRVTGG